MTARQLVNPQTGVGDIDGIYASITEPIAVALAAGFAAVSGIFGDGSDGAVVMDGTNTFSGFASLSGSTYTLTRAMFATTLEVKNGITLKPANYPFFATTSITVDSGGIIDSSGGAGSATGTAGTPIGNGWYASVAAGTGGTGAASNISGNGPIGTAGGSGAGGLGSSGAGGTTQGALINSTWPFRMLTILQAAQFYVSGNVHPVTCSGAGAGGGDGTNKGGGGGAAAGYIVMFSPLITNSGTISANGGTGGTPTTGNCGGGGGGHGGIIVGYSLAAWTAGTMTVTAGAHGNGVGSGVNGTSGNVGGILNVVL